MNEDEIVRIVSEAAVEDGGTRTLPCARAFAIAEEHAVPLGEIGDACNRGGIKIVRCQLGCFD